jgi:hypothetical protein
MFPPSEESVPINGEVSVEPLDVLMVDGLSALLGKGRTMKAKAILAVVVAVLLASTISAAPIEWPKAVGGNGHFYEAVVVPGITWTEAQLAAEAKGGYLATISSPEENAFVFSVADGGWGWVTGEPFNYDNWSPESPNNGSVTSGPEDRIHFWTMGTSLDDRVPTWNDAAASDLHINSYVIEVPEPATLSLLVLAGLAVIRRRRR